MRFQIVEELEAGPEAPEVTLYIALIKFDRLEWAVEKATELGVTRIVPVAAQRSDRGLFEGAQKRVERWRRIAHEASEQSRRLRVPDIDAPAKMSDGTARAFLPGDFGATNGQVLQRSALRTVRPQETQRRCSWDRKAAGRIPSERSSERRGGRASPWGRWCCARKPLFARRWR